MSGNQRRILCYVTDRAATPALAGIAAPDAECIARLSAKIHAAIAAGVDWIQIREKDLSAKILCALSVGAVSAARNSEARVIVNDRLDVAVAAQAGGVHLGRESLPLREVAAWRAAQIAARPALKDFLIGASCHSLDEARVAASDGADYVIFGPVFATPSKARFGAPAGIERLREICSALQIPVLAIGGINTSNARECFQAGAAGIAAIRMFQEAANVDELRQRIEALRKL